MPVYQLSDDIIFPPPHLAGPEGLLAVGGDLSPERLLLAYASGIFPWYSAGDPILWWSPDPRLVLYLGELHISRSLAKMLRRKLYRVTFDTRFGTVISACARMRGPNRKGTWITDEMKTAYVRLHELGYAHSVEVWTRQEIVGGLYGISLGRCFFGESMFSTMRDASKAALVALRDFLSAYDFSFIDCQVPSEHLTRMGAHTVSRQTFLSQLTGALNHPSMSGSWTRLWEKLC
jgi:leucyl/phenylalanyl-tRNA--protein transferase